MTVATLVDGLTPVVGDDVRTAESILGRRFPFAVIWFGAATRRWWAMVRTGGRWGLLEASGPEELTRAIICAIR